MRSVSEIKLSIRNINLAAMHWRCESEHKILAVHGWLDNAESFSGLAEFLPDHEIVALDFPGHGHSDHRPQGEILHYIDYIVDIYEVLKVLGWNQCVLLGHSMGAGVASVFASAFPDKLQGLICLDGLGPITIAADHLSERLNKSVRMNIKSAAKNKTVYPDIDTAVEARHQAGDISLESVKKLVRRNLKKVDSNNANRGYIWRSDARLRLPSMYYLSEEQAQGYMRKIDIPTLMIRPVDSNFRAQPILKQRASLINDLTWQDVPGGHHVHMDDPEVVLPAIKGFLQRLENE